MSEDIAVVLDPGSQSTKAGFAGESFPRCLIPSIVARFRHQGLTGGLPDVCFGSEAEQKRGLAISSYPIKCGMIDNWDDMEKFWHHIFYKELHVAPERTRVLHVIHPLTRRKDKERMAEIMFESFTVPALYLAASPALVLHASGRTSGVVWESGFSCSHAAPVFEGFPLKHATVTTNINGDVLTDVLQSFLKNKGYSFTTPFERNLLQQMKAQLCYVSEDYDQEVTRANEVNEARFDLPDGQHVLLGEERFRCPEILFQPSLNGFNCMNVVDAVASSVDKCDIDYKGLFYGNIVISGGSSMFPGFDRRLYIELRKRVSDLPDIKAFIDALPSREIGAWVGGSILASLPILNGFWMTREEYDDDGPDRVNYRVF